MRAIEEKLDRAEDKICRYRKENRRLRTKNRMLRQSEEAIRLDERQRCWNEINEQIVHGPLPGTGCDKSAERNGLILATNILLSKLLQKSASPCYPSLGDSMRSPIKMMIDKATGYDLSKKPDLITLRCPQCGKEKKAPRDKSDLPGTAVVVAHCDKCSGEDNGLYPEYLREDGTQILE